MVDDLKTDKLNCSFCGKAQNEVKKLIAAQVYIFVTSVSIYVMISSKKKLRVKRIHQMITYFLH